MPPKKAKATEATKQHVVVNEDVNATEVLESKVETPKACIDKDSGEKVKGPLLNTETVIVGTNEADVVEIREESDSNEPKQRNYDELTHDKELRFEMAVNAKHERSICMEEFRRELSMLQHLTKDFETKPEEVNARRDRYEQTFHKFVISHENYMQHEDDIEKKDLMTDNYNDQRDVKLQLDYMVDLWQTNRERYLKPPSESGYSLASRKSRSSRTSSRSSVKERRKVMEEAKLKMQTLKEKQELERQLEVAEQSKTELSRKIKLLNAEAELKQAKIDFVIDQIPDDEGVDGMNEYLRDFQGPTCPEKSEITYPSQPKFVPEHPPTPHSPAAQVQPPAPLLHNHPSPEPRPDVPNLATTESDRFDIPKVGLDVTRNEFYPNANHEATNTLQEEPAPPPQPQLDVWNSIAQAIKEGPSLPKIELMRFGGDPLEYVEFVTNFKDNIESQVSDDSQRFTRLLAQCVGKAKDAIRSCVNLDVGQRYKEAKSCLLENFGQPHIIVEAHMKKLRELQIRKTDANALMEFVRHLEDSERALKSMGSSYSNRLDNEDVIVMLMRKLPEDGLKRKWVDRAGDLIKSKDYVQFDDFVNFLKKVAGRINNRYGRELKQASEDKKFQNRSRFEQQRRVNANAIQGGLNKEDTPVRTG
ncbi:Hypothetical predicted protein, partial [Paramuricea clavata]